MCYIVVDVSERIQQNAPPALLITDVKLPGMGGWALSLQLRHRWPSLPILFMSGYSTDALSHDGSAKPDDVLIEKPFTPAALLAQINTMLSAQSLNNETNVF